MPTSDLEHPKELNPIYNVVDEDGEGYEITDRRPKRRRITHDHAIDADPQAPNNHAAINESDTDTINVINEELALESAATPRILFDIVEKETRFVISIKNDVLEGKDKIKKEARMAHCVNPPYELYTTHDMSSEEFDEFVYKKVTWKPVFQLTKKGKEWIERPFAAMLSAKRCQELGLREIQEKIRTYLADKDFSQFMMNAQLASQVKKRGNACDATIATYPGHIPEGIRFSMALRKAMDESQHKKWLAVLQHLTQLFGEADDIALSAMWGPEIAEEFKEEYEINRISNASMTNGHSMMSGTQFGWTKSQQTNKDSLGEHRGDVHPDPNDDPTRISLLYIFDNIASDQFSGRFNITSARISFPIEPFAIVGFTARHPHTSSGAGRFDDDLSEEERRYESDYIEPLVGESWFQGLIHVIRYSRMDANRARIHQINPEWMDPKNEDAAVAHFGTIEAYKTWLMLMHIKRNVVDIREKIEAGEQSALEITKMFSFTDAVTRETRYPSLHEAQICIDNAIDPIPEHLKPDSEEYKKAKKAQDKAFHKTSFGQLHDAYLFTTCGDEVKKELVPGTLDYKLYWANKKWRDNKGQRETVQCGAVLGGNRVCKAKTNDVSLKCRHH